jgi:hypothetical protein
VNGQSRDARINPATSALSAVRIAAVRPEGADPVHDRVQSAQDRSHVDRDFVGDAGLVRRQAEGIRTA